MRIAENLQISKVERIKRGCLFILTVVLCLSLKLPVEAAVTQKDLEGPVVDTKSHVPYTSEGKHSSNYHYIYFGSYPQREITGTALTEEIKNASYDVNGEAEIGGRRYRRLTWSMTNREGSINATNWFKTEWEKISNNGYRYFLYEPIRWRILSNSGDQLMLLSELELDVQIMNDYYATGETKNPWATCKLRAWLNYDGSQQLNLSVKYKSKGFLCFAFTKEEQNQLLLTHLTQADNPKHGTDGGCDTDDKIYLLSYADINNPAYGFCAKKEYNGISCSALSGYPSDFAFAMDADPREYRVSSKPYWLRTPGDSQFTFMRVVTEGKTGYNGDNFNQNGNAVRPVANVKYSTSDFIRITFVTESANTIEDQIILGSNVAVEPKAPIKEGVLFSGWYMDKACTIPYQFNEKLSADTTLYAGWKQKELEQNTIFSSNDIIYRVTSSSAKTAEYCGVSAQKAKKVKKISIPSTVSCQGVTYKVTTIGKGACKNYKKLTKVTIGKNIVKIADNAFYGCSKLVTVKFSGTKVTEIKQGAFRKCSRLKSITIPKTVKKIGKNAFRDCKKLKTITLKTIKLTSKKVGKYAFKGISSKATFKMPKKKYKAYKKIFMKKTIGYKKGMKIRKIK